MQDRHSNRKQYFEELSKSSRDFFLPYIEQFFKLAPGMRVLEVGCGEGGNLLPFSQRGCSVTGVDACEGRIDEARTFFAEEGGKGEFHYMDFLKFPVPEECDRYDVVICHDVIEHIEPPYKQDFLRHIRECMKDGGVAFFGFPAWQMPFGGHQQCGSSFMSKMPFVHLLPLPVYKGMLKMAGEKEGMVDFLLSTRRAQVPMELFESLCAECGFHVIDRLLWFINPHYQQKFNLKPRKVLGLFRHIRWFRNFYTTSCFYMLRKK